MRSTFAWLDFLPIFNGAVRGRAVVNISMLKVKVIYLK